VSKIMEAVDVRVPVRTAYDQWTQFETFPTFMDGVKSVRQLDDSTLEWVADVAGREKRREAKITEQEPDQRIAWTSTEGAHNAGMVTFHPIDDGTSRVTLQLDVDPEGPVENAGGLHQGARDRDGRLARRRPPALALKLPCPPPR